MTLDDEAIDFKRDSGHDAYAVANPYPLQNILNAQAGTAAATEV